MKKYNENFLDFLGLQEFSNLQEIIDYCDSKGVAYKKVIIGYADENNGNELFEVIDDKDLVFNSMPISNKDLEVLQKLFNKFSFDFVKENTGNPEQDHIDAVNRFSDLQKNKDHNYLLFMHILEKYMPLLYQFSRFIKDQNQKV